MRRWALRLARWLDRNGELPDETRALDAALSLFGVSRFRDGQLEPVLAALRGESMLVIRPTGAGKSLCYQLPAVLKAGSASVVLSPLKALMVDQVGGLHRRRLPATFINSDVGREEKEKRYELLEAGGLALLYVAPERFNPERVSEYEIARISRQRPAYLVVDEAHLVDRWGEDFRIDYSRIADIRRQLGSPPVLAFTATAGVNTQKRIKESLGIPDARTYVSGVDRPNIALVRLTSSSDRERAAIVARLIETLPDGRLMLFVPTTKIGRQAQAELARAGCDLLLYHAKLPAPEREHILGRFTGDAQPALKAVICTSAFSMGLDVPDVRVVVNWQHPGAVEDYLQEFGRAGRDGHPAVAVLFSEGGRETGLLRWMANKTREEVVASGKRTPEQAQLTYRGRLDRIEELAKLVGDRDHCMRRGLNDALAGNFKSRRASVPVRLVSWTLAERTRVEPGDGCCDACDPQLADQIRVGGYVPRTPRPASGPQAGPADSSTRKRRRVFLRVVPPIALALLIGIAAGAGNSGDASAARDVFTRYTAAFAEPGEFGMPTATPDDKGHLVCGRHVPPGSGGSSDYSLCLLVDVGRDPGQQVTGGYRQDRSRIYDCYRAAVSSVAGCRPK